MQFELKAEWTKTHDDKTPSGPQVMGRDSSVGKASDRKAKSNTDEGSIPRCDEGYFSPSKPASQTQKSVVQVTPLSTTPSHA